MLPGNRVVHGAIVLVAVVAAIGGTAYINNNGSRSASSSNPKTKTTTAVTPNNNLAVGAWLPYWDDGSGLTTFKNNSKDISELHPFEYQATSATNITLQGNLTHAQSVNAAIKKTNATNIPTLTETMNNTDFATMADDPVQVAAHAQAVCSFVSKYGYAGIDIDYENFFLNIPSADSAAYAPKYTTVVTAIADCLHAEKKTLEVTILPRTGDPRWTYFEAHQAAGVFDYTALGKVADYVNVMAYDFTYPGSSPGSTDPIEWVKAVAKYTTAHVPAAKVNLGLPLYGYNWVTKGSSSTAANSVTLAAKYNVIPTRDPASQSLVFTFADAQGNNHTVWYDDAQATALRVQAARDAGLHGVVFWTIGDEVPGTWPLLTKAP